MTSSELHLLCLALGERVEQICRLFYLCQDEQDTHAGEITFTFAGGKTLRLTHTPSGYDLAVATERWQDPFAEPLDAANQEWVQVYGKWIELDVSGEAQWRPFVGKRLTRVDRLIYVDHGEACGVALGFGDELAVFVHNLADEVIVERGVASPWLHKQPLCSLWEPSQ